ncbi:MAG: hypothetical protein GVY36_14150 [Verrucomicrobia bacterium]|jgi:surface-anchored protein|nr:hypothetical protein [Verrucomicrobiota bacterium]
MMNKFYRQFCFMPLISVAASLGLSAQVLLEDHTDITFSFSTANDEWEGEFRHGGTFDDPATETAFDQASLPARDFPTPGGDRYAQPSSSSFDFTGIPDGEPLWILPQTDVGHTWPGFRNDQTPGTFRAYNPGDSRVTTVPQPWVKIELHGVTYVGTAANPEFSLWQFQNGVVQWMATSVGIDVGDLFYLKENAHAHLNFGFSALGIYRVAFKPSAILDSTGETVEGAPEVVTFAIGTKATWLASHYSGDDLSHESVSGDQSDSDQDGIPLLLEYAFNLNPTLSDRKTLEPPTGTAGLPATRLVSDGQHSALRLEYIRRKASTNPQISYFAEFTSDLNSEAWVVQTAETVTSIDDTWEHVVVDDTVSTAVADRRFGRVRIEMQDTISY